MIKTVTSSSPHIYAAGGSNLPYIGVNPNNPAQGTVRISNTDLQVFDGNNWQTIYGGAISVGMNADADNAISWAISKMKIEKEWEELAKKNQAVKIALENLENARRQLDITAKIARENEQATS